MKLLGSIAALTLGAVYSERLQRPPRLRLDGNAPIERNRWKMPIKTKAQQNKKNKRKAQRKARRITRANK